MIITITPEDIIKRGLWNDYRRYVLKGKTEDEIKELVKQNQPTTISEEDGFVIGLLKVIETDNLVHRFNQYLLELLQIRSNIIDDTLFINRNVLFKQLNMYKKNFPEYFPADENYQKSIDNLFEYINKLYEKFKELEIITYTNNDKNYDYLKSAKVKKCLEDI